MKPFVHGSSLSLVISAMVCSGKVIHQSSSNHLHNALALNPMNELSSEPEAPKVSQSIAEIMFDNPTSNHSDSDLLADDTSHQASVRSPIRAKDFLTISEIPDDFHSTPVSYPAYAGSGPGQRLPISVNKQQLQVINANAMRRYSISTILAGTLFYSLTILPLIMMLTSTGPFSGFGSMAPQQSSGMMMMGKRRRRRSLPVRHHHDRVQHYQQLSRMPLLDRSNSVRFLALLQSTLALRQVHDLNCRKLYLCQVYAHVIRQSQRPVTLHSFEDALLSTFG
jgi:hypothetical protein